MLFDESEYRTSDHIRISLNLDHELTLVARLGRYNEVVIAVRAVFVRLVEFTDIFAEHFFAFLAGESDFPRFEQLVVRFFGVALQWIKNVRAE